MRVKFSRNSLSFLVRPTDCCRSPFEIFRFSEGTSDRKSVVFRRGDGTGAGSLNAKSVADTEVMVGFRAIDAQICAPAALAHYTSQLSQADFCPRDYSGTETGSGHCSVTQC